MEFSFVTSIHFICSGFTFFLINFQNFLHTLNVQKGSPVYQVLLSYHKSLKNAISKNPVISEAQTEKRNPDALANRRVQPEFSVFNYSTGTVFDFV